MCYRHGHHLLPMPGAHTATAFPLLYVKQQEGCYIILVYKISLIIESLFLYHNANHAFSFGYVNAYCVHGFSSIILYLQLESIFYSLPIQSIG